MGRDRELMDVFGHTQAEVDKMNEDQKNKIIMQAYTKQKQKDAQQQAQLKNKQKNSESTGRRIDGDGSYVRRNEGEQ